MRKLSFAIAGLLAICAPAQSPLDDFKEKLREGFDSFAAGNRRDYERFWAELDSSYAAFMANPWTPVELTPPRPLPPLPRPEPQPVVVIDTTPRPVIHIRRVVPVPVPQPQPVPVVPIIKNDEDNRDRYRNTILHEFEFYGTDAAVSCPAALSSVRIDAGASNPYGEAMLQMGELDYGAMVSELLELRRDRNLCDWAYKGMLAQLAESVMGSGTNEAQLLYGLLMARSGYKVRFGRYTTPDSAAERLCVLFAADGYCLDVANAWLDGCSFYAERNIPRDASMEVCEFAMPSETAIGLAITSLPKLAVRHAPVREMPVKYVSTADTLRVASNINMIRFLDSYPKVNTDGWLSAWSTCGNIPFSDDLRSQLYPQLRRLIAGKNEVEAAEYLLHVAQSFPYEYDDEMWGNDYPLAAEQTWYHVGSDCEDHAIHFSRLVRDLLGLDTALAYVPGHLVAAIIFKEHNVEGQTMSCGDKTYLVCDPTYYGASLGKTFIEYDDSNSYLILLE